jgi:hypothetical protein
MLSNLLPTQFDNAYRGHALAFWLLIPLVLMKLFMGVNVAGLNPWISSRFVLQNADGVPVDTFPAEAASVAVFLFASWGLSLLVMSLLGVVVLIRYRAMIPLMYLLLSIEQIGRKALGMLHLVPSSGEAAAGVSPGLLINGGLSAALVIGLLLSLISVRKGETPKRTASG